MCQSLPEITGDGACVCARSARVRAMFECARLDVCTTQRRVWTGYGVRTTLRTSNTIAGTAAVAYELMNTERYVRNYQSV